MALRGSRCLHIECSSELAAGCHGLAVGDAGPALDPEVGLTANQQGERVGAGSRASRARHQARQTGGLSNVETEQSNVATDPDRRSRPLLCGSYI